MESLAVFVSFGRVDFDPNQEDGLSQAMNSALKNKDLLIEMGERNYKQSQEWDWNTIAEKTFQIYIKRST